MLVAILLPGHSGYGKYDGHGEITGHRSVGEVVDGMVFATLDGRSTWDQSGKF